MNIFASREIPSSPQGPWDICSGISSAESYLQVGRAVRDEKARRDNVDKALCTFCPASASDASLSLFQMAEKYGPGADHPKRCKRDISRQIRSHTPDLALFLPNSYTGY